MVGFLNFLRTRDIPPASRHNYQVELRHTLAWGICAGVIEGNISGIVAAKTFGGSELLITTVFASANLANLLSIFWGAWLRGRPKLQAFILLWIAAILFLFTIGLTPNNRVWGGWLFAGQLALSRIFLAGVITLRSGIWQANYPDSHRGQITSRLQMVRFMTGLMATAGVSLLFDEHAELYRYVYPAVALIGALSLVPLRRLRLGGDAGALQTESGSMRQSTDPDVSESDSNGRPPARSPHSGVIANLKESVSILRRDRAFARYCQAQHLLGSSNFMMDAVLLIVIPRDLRFDYFASTFLMDTLPALVMVFLAIPASGRHFDRVGVLWFRVSNSAFWMVSHSVSVIAIVLIQFGGTAWLHAIVPLLLAARFMNGVGRGGGAIAWHLGHLHFARPENADLYMGIHQALTGIRGLLMPYVGTLVYRLAGWASPAIALGLSFSAWVLFRRMAVADRRGPSPAEAHAQDLGASPARTDVT